LASDLDVTLSVVCNKLKERDKKKQEEAFYWVPFKRFYCIEGINAVHNGLLAGKRETGVGWRLKVFTEINYTSFQMARPLLGIKAARVWKENID